MSQPTDQACGGAPGTPKPNFGPIVQVGSDVIATLLTAGTDGAAAIALGVALGGLQFDLNEQCASGDPGDPGMTDQDWSNLANFLNIAAFGATLPKAKQWLIHQLWPVWCNCADGTSVAPPPVGTLPNGTQNPGLNQPIGANCYDHTVALPTGGANGANWFPGAMFPQTTIHNPGPQQGYDIPLPLPAACEVIATCNSEGSQPLTLDFFFNFFTSAGTVISASSFMVGPVAPGTTVSSGPVAVPTNAAWWNCVAGTAEGGALVATNTATAEFVIFCQGQSPTTIVSDCCPPDPNVDSKLSLIIQLLANLPTSSVSTSWADGTSHAGLSGSGNFAIASGVTGVRATFTTIPSDIRVTPGDPTFYWDLGFVTPMANLFPFRSMRTVFNSQTMSLPPQATELAYTFPAGVVCTLTELIPS